MPHLAFEERDDPDDPRELKSAASVRVVPLVGVALEVFRRFPDGFSRYREREEALSQLVNKYLRNNGLTTTPQHSLYGLRHSIQLSTPLEAKSRLGIFVTFLTTADSR